MTKIKIADKKQIHGGMTPTMIWVALMGSVMIAQTISSIVQDVTSNFRPVNNDGNGSFSASKSSGTYMRLSPMPMRSAIGMWC